MSRADNADWGTTFETAAIDAADLEDVTDAGDEHQYVDAVATRAVHPRSICDAQRPVYQFSGKVQPGDRIACKAARYRVSDGASTRRGRWWITRDEHETVDAYALGVYTEGAGVLEGGLILLPRDDVDDLIGSWTSCHAWDRTDEAARISWARVFDPAEVSADGE